MLKISLSTASDMCPAMTLPIMPLEFHLEAVDHLSLPPYKGSTMRGGLGWALKPFFCTSPYLTCVSCPQAFTCGYPWLFETRHPNPGPDGRRRPAPEPLPSRVPRPAASPPGHSHPRPFVLLPPLSQETEFSPGSRLILGLTLIGRAIDYLPFFLLAVEHMARAGLGRGWSRGRGRVRLLEARSPAPEAAPLYDGATRLIQEPLPVQHWSPDPDPKAQDRDLTLTFLTPARLVNRKQLVRQLSFAVLIRNLLRRLHHLAAFAPQGIDLDYSGLARAAEEVATGAQDLTWHAWQRYSHRQDRPVDMDGLVGSVQYLAVPPLFHPLLELGQWVHVGKGTSSGLGKYIVQG